MNKIFYVFLLSALIFSLLTMPLTVFAQTSGNQKSIQSTSTSLNAKVAPGEILPISVKLSNFGGGKRVDVVISYLITSEKGDTIYKTTETVAVETTNNFLKNVQIPPSATPGIYNAKTSIIYPEQSAPATTEFTFSVERKILGVFQNSFLLYGGIMLFIAITTALIVFSLSKRRSFSRFGPIDYSNIPPNERVFYELISDTVMNMRHKVGDQALDIAATIEGLTINKDSGRIIKLTRSPSKIVAELVSEYEKNLGKKISFSFRGEQL